MQLEHHKTRLLGGGGHGQVVPVPGGPGEGAGVGGGAIVLGALELGLQREYI